MCQAKIHAKINSKPNDFCFVQFDEGSFNVKAIAFYARFGSTVYCQLKCCDEFWSAVGITGVIDSVHADENVLCADRFRPAYRKCQHDNIPRRYIGDRDFIADVTLVNILGNINISLKAEPPN
jgi:hypothetical protein